MPPEKPRISSVFLVFVTCSSLFRKSKKLQIKRCRSRASELYGDSNLFIGGPAVRINCRKSSSEIDEMTGAVNCFSFSVGFKGGRTKEDILFKFNIFVFVCCFVVLHFPTIVPRRICKNISILFWCEIYKRCGEVVQMIINIEKIAKGSGITLEELFKQIGEMGLIKKYREESGIIDTDASVLGHT